MVDCPACFGEGVHDLRDMDAFLLEHQVMAMMREREAI